MQNCRVVITRKFWPCYVVNDVITMFNVVNRCYCVNTCYARTLIIQSQGKNEASVIVRDSSGVSTSSSNSKIFHFFQFIKKIFNRSLFGLVVGETVLYYLQYNTCKQFMFRFEWLTHIKISHTRESIAPIKGANPKSALRRNSTKSKYR